MKVSAAQIIGGNSFSGRQKNDFYRTPPEAVTALLRNCSAHKIWEPCCGDGRISEVLLRAGRDVISTDLFDRGYGTHGIDFLKTDKLLAPAIITNPPFNIASEIIVHAHVLGVQWMALLLKQTFWNTRKRTVLFERFRPSEIHALNWRLDFLNGGSPTMDCMWVIWDGESRTTEFKIMGKT